MAPTIARLDPKRYAVTGDYVRERLDAEREAGEAVAALLFRVERGDQAAALELGRAMRAHSEAVDRLDGAMRVCSLLMKSEGPLAQGRPLTRWESHDLEVALKRAGMW